MKNQGISAELRDFVRKIFAIDVGIFFVAGVVSLSLHIYFFIVLFGLGIIFTVVGAYLGGPNMYDPQNPRISYSNPYEQPSAKRLTERVLFFVKNSVPIYAFENIFLFAGLIAVLISLLFLF